MSWWKILLNGAVLCELCLDLSRKRRQSRKKDRSRQTKDNTTAPPPLKREFRYRIDFGSHHSSYSSSGSRPAGVMWHDPKMPSHPDVRSIIALVAFSSPWLRWLAVIPNRPKPKKLVLCKMQIDKQWRRNTLGIHEWAQHWITSLIPNHQQVLWPISWNTNEIANFLFPRCPKISLGCSLECMPFAEQQTSLTSTHTHTCMRARGCHRFCIRFALGVFAGAHHTRTHIHWDRCSKRMMRVDLQLGACNIQKHRHIF